MCARKSAQRIKDWCGGRNYAKRNGLCAATREAVLVDRSRIWKISHDPNAHHKSMDMMFILPKNPA
jgi:hypothetical protein